MTFRSSALVTGAAQGMGKAIALRLAQDGFDIFLNDIPSKSTLADTVAKEIKDKCPGCEVYLVLADVSDEPQVAGMFDRIRENPSTRLKIVVANAGICPYKSFLDTTLDDMDKIFRVNFTGVFLCYKYGAKYMIEKNIAGRLVGASSLTGKEAISAATAYSCSKFAVRSLTQCAAQELATYGITCNAYCPGYIATEMTEAWLENVPNAQAIIDHESSKAALNRRGRPDEVAALVSFFASDASSYITGQSINVCGGRKFD